MKLETLNIWGGRVYEPLTQHIKHQSHQVDIFCFQEVYHTPLQRIYTREITDDSGSSPVANEIPARADIYQRIVDVLPDFKGYYRSAQRGLDYKGRVDYELYFGLAMFLRNGIDVKEEGEIFVYRHKDSEVEGDHTSLGRNLQYVQFNKDGQEFTVANLHGLWNGGGKGDAPERLEQSKKVKAFLERIEGPKILCGDFNLLPTTESITILEQGMRNLVKDYSITSTRSEFYTKPEKFADYILVSPEVEVRDFRVIQDPVSDHLPLFLEFN